MSGVLGGPGGAGVAVGGASSELLTVTVVRDEHGYGMKVSGDNPVYVQSVKSNGAAWRAGLRAGDRIVCVNQIPVPTHTHVQVVDMIRGSPTALLTVQQTTQKRQSSSITAPVPVDREKQRQLEFTKIHTIMLMLDNEKRHMETLKKELSRGSDARKQEELDSAEQRCIKLQHQIDIISQPLHPAQQDSALSASQPQLSPQSPQPQTPRLSSVRTHRVNSGSGVATSTGFLSGLPRSLSNLTGQSLRNLRQARQNMMMSGGKSQTPDMNSPNLERQLSENGEMSSGNVKRTRHGHNNTVPMVPVTCLDGLGPPPLPPRSTERLMKPKRISNPGISSKISSPPSFHGSMGSSYPSGQEGYGIRSPYTRSARSLDVSAETTDGRQTDESGIPNSIAMQMSYPLVAVTHPPIQSGNLGLTAHSRSQSSPEHLDTSSKNISEDKGHWECGMSPPGTPPPPYPCAPPIPPPNTQPCADPQRAIISMEEDESPTSDSSGGLFSSLRNVLESKAKSAVLLNWLLGERRSSNAHLLLLVTEAYRRGGGVGGGGGAGGAGVLATRRWAYEIHSTFVMPGAVLALNNPDENLAREVDEILQNEYDKEEILRNVFRKARSKAKEELTQQLSDFQVKRHLGLGELYSPPDHILEKCDTDKSQESAVVESLLRSRLSSLGAEARGDTWGCTHGSPAAAPAAAALAAAAHHELGVRTSMIAEAFGTGGGNRAAFLQRDKHYKQRLKQISKQTAQPFVVRGHHLSLQAMLSVAHCHHCHIVVWGLAPQAYVCGDCQLTVHRSCARSVEEACCGPSDEHQPRRISRLMDKIHATAHQDGQDRKSRKTSSTSNFLNMERNARKHEDDAAWDTSNHNTSQGENRREGSDESSAVTADGDADTSHEADKENADKDVPKHETQGLWRSGGWGGKPVARAESCRDSGGAGAGSAGAPGARRGKQRNASDPNRLTAAAHHSDAEILPGANDPSVSSSSSSLSTRSNDSNTNVDTNNQAQSQSSSSDEEEMLGEQWISSVSPEIVESLSSRHRKRQEVIHELITSERSHIRWLRVLHALYLRPLERAPPPPAPRLLPLDEVRALMPNLPGVRERHARLYADLRALRTREGIVPVRGVADAVLNTLGAPDYVVTVSVFCRGQRRALEALRERRRKAKELHAFLARAEQAPKCGRLQLRDLLACVWQRLTKYQLLLESILKTITEEDAENEEDVDRLRLALATAKEVLQGVDAAIRRDENEHRLRTIQSKMEVRPGVVGGAGGTAGGAGSSGSLVAACTADVEEMKRLDLTAHNLLLEGELTVRQDTNKKTILLALLLEDCLVLLHRDGDKFVLKQINQPSQQTLLSPIVRWSTVLFRPNAAVKNGFFLVNVNGIQMYELSTNTHTEYNTWSKHISEVPLALSNRPRNTQPSHAHNAEASISRNPSNASAKSESSLPETETETSTAGSEEAPTELNTSAHTHTDSLNISLEPHDKEPEQQEQHEQGGVSTNGRVVQHPSECPAPLELPGAVTVKAPPITQQAVLTTTVEGRLRRLDKTISAAMQAKAALVSQTLGMSSHKAGDQPYADMKPAELEKMLECIDSHGAEPQPERNDFDSCMDSSGLSDEDEGPSLLQLTGRDRTVHQLLLAAQAQANLLQETLNRTFELTSFDCHNLKGWQREGLCDTCVEQPLYSNTEPVTSGNTNFVSGINAQDMRCGVGIEKEISFDMLSELDRSCEELEGDCEEVERRRQTLAEQRLGNVILMEHIGESSTDPLPALAAPPIGCPPLPTESAHSLARALAPASCALGSALSALASALPAAARERTRLRRALRQANERYQRLAHRHRDCHTHGAAPVDSGGANLDQNLQDQPNGGG